MTFPERTKPNIFGAVVGARAVSSLGLACDGLTISNGTQEIGDGPVEERVTLASVPDFEAASRELADACQAGLKRDGS
ncbi:hypothetical protein [Sulfitobacter pontiacus]|uniref:hypothetical protein n=1 Tax=Sulfitobacter pontiacus TaxID=60137 RepID=UPI0030EC0924